MEVYMSRKLVVSSSILVIAALLASCAPATAKTAGSTATAPLSAATQAAPAANSITTFQEQAAFEQIYANVNPSVVDIRVVETLAASQQQSQYQVPDIPGMPQFSQPQSNVPTQVEGAGFIYDTKGDIITNNHVVTDASRIIVTFYDGTQADATLVGTDPGTDLAVIKVSVDASLLKPVTLADSTQAKVGQLVLAIGSPFMLQGSMTSGIISALGRYIEDSGTVTSATSGVYSIPDIIQTDAAINHGNSGGPLLDLNGDVIGVNTAIESTSDSNAGVGYSIPSAIVKLVADELISSGKFVHTYLGITPEDMDADLAKAMNLPLSTRGLLIKGVGAGSPAETAGLKGYTTEVTIDGLTAYVGGDIITSIDGITVKDYNTLISYLLMHTKVGQKVSLGIIRDGKNMTVDVTLQARPAES
jgi:serine protease Do